MSLPNEIPRNLFAGADVVYHLAGHAHAMASTVADATAHDQINAKGTEEVAKRAKEAGVSRFVFMSTVKALGEPGQQIVAEGQESMAGDPYGSSKRRAELALLGLQTQDFQVVILRPVLVYGPGAKGNLENLLRLLRTGRLPPLPKITNRRSLVGVNDLVTATVLAGEHPGLVGAAHTVTDGQVYSTSDIIEALADAMGVTRRPILVLPAPALRAAARLGDATYRLTGRRLPFDSDVLRRLFGNAEYEARSLKRLAGFSPGETLRDLAPAMVQSSQ
jgi:nucleoside-diphosphate-sugar epimerase